MGIVGKSFVTLVVVGAAVSVVASL